MVRNLYILSFVFLIGLAAPLLAQSDSIDPSYKKMIERKYDGFPTIQPAEAQTKLNKDILFLDTRSKSEFEVSHIPNALYIDYDNFKLASLDSIDRSKEIIVYCSIGVRSQDIGKQLKENGFTNVKNLYGGIFLWADQGRAMKNSNNDETTKVHGYNFFWGRWVKNAEVVYSD
jgi:rhodanese-related sulfurtransferase